MGRTAEVEAVSRNENLGVAAAIARSTIVAAPRGWLVSVAVSVHGGLEEG
jgi:hypothetical protein